MIGKCDHFDDNLVVNCSGKDDLGSMEQNLNHQPQSRSASKEQIDMIRKNSYNAIENGEKSQDSNIKCT